MSQLSRRFPRYSRLLGLYPPAYRAAYGEQMLQTLADMLDDATPAGRRRVWLHAALDLPISIIHQQLVYEGEIMTDQVPTYVKQNGLLGAWLLAPFFIFIILDSVVRGRLQHTFIWHTQALFIWLVVLPAVAVLLNVAALLRWIHSRRQGGKVSLWRLLTDVHHNWPSLVMVVLGVGILGLVFFHDSVHCVTGNPVRELHNTSQTWRCVEQR